MAEFGQKIKQAREEKGMTQQALADRLYVTRQTISRWESGTRYPDLPTAKKIADILEIPLDDLLSGEDLEKIKKRIKLQKRKNQLLVLLIACGVFSGIFAKVRNITWNKTMTMVDSEKETYESEEEILQNLSLGESTYFEGYFYSAAFTATSQQMNLVDSEGNVYMPVAVRPVSESGEVMADLAAEQEGVMYSPVFQFETGQTELDSLETLRVLLTGLTYWVDEDGTILYDPIICGFRFPVMENGNYSTGVGYDAAEIREQENGDTFLEDYEAWMDEVHEEGSIVKTSETTTYDAVLTYEVEYPDYFELVYEGEGGYEVYTWPVGTLEIQIREKDDGEYEIVETRNYYLSQEFLENTDQYTLEIMKENAAELSVNATSSVTDAVRDAITMNASSLNPVVDETVVYVADMPDELRQLIDELRLALNE